MRLSLTRFVIAMFAVGALNVVAGGVAAAAAPSASQIVSNAIAATEAVTSITIVGTVVDNSQRISLDVSATNTGVGQGKIGIGTGTALVRAVNGTIYFMGTSTFWRQHGGQSAAELFAGRWVSTSASTKNGSQLAQYLNSTTFMKQIFSSGISNSVFTKAGTARVRGNRAIVIAGTDTKDNSGGKIFVASTGTPYILRITVSGASGTGSMNFSNYNGQVHPAVPSNAIDLDTLGGSSGG